MVPMLALRLKDHPSSAEAATGYQAAATGNRCVTEGSAGHHKGDPSHQERRMRSEDSPGHPGNVYEYLGEVGIAAHNAISSTSGMDSAEAALVHSQVALANAIAGLAAAIHLHQEGR